MLVILTLIIIFAVALQIRRSCGARQRALGSIALLVFTAIIVFMSGQHKCEEGTVPLFIACTTAVLAASLPWVLCSRPWLMIGLVVLVVIGGVTIASCLATSYHQDSITGNPKFASGRFWYTRLTGQYPRDQKLTYEALLEGDVRPVKAATTNSEPTNGASSVPATQP